MPSTDPLTNGVVTRSRRGARVKKCAVPMSTSSQVPARSGGGVKVIVVFWSRRTTPPSRRTMAAAERAETDRVAQAMRGADLDREPLRFAGASGLDAALDGDGSRYHSGQSAAALGGGVGARTSRIRHRPNNSL